MKTVKSSLLGACRLDDNNPTELLTQFSEMLRQHRVIIITRLLVDLPAYLNYKFQLAKPSRKQLDEVTDKLLSIQKDSVQLSNYDSILQQLLSQTAVRLINEPFYLEIDQAIVPLVAKPMSIFINH